MYITLQPWLPADAPVLAEHFNNITIWNNLRDAVPHPYTVTDAEAFIAAQQDIFPARNFAIHNEGQIVGGIGINLLEDVYRMNVELGYWVAQPFWNMSIASIAVGLMTEYVFATFQINRIVAEVFDHNKASMRVLEKNGFFLESVRRKSVLKNDLLRDDFIWVKQRIY